MGKGIIIKSILGIVVFLSAVSTWAAPALRGSFTVRQPDGTFLTIEQFGDEYHHWTSTSDGTLVVNKGGTYYVAAIDDTGRLLPTDLLAHDAAERNNKEQQLIDAQTSRCQMPVFLLRSEHQAQTTSILPSWLPRLMLISTRFRVFAWPLQQREAFISTAGKRSW